MIPQKVIAVANILEQHKELVEFDTNKFVAKKNFDLLEQACKASGIPVEKSGGVLKLQLQPFLNIPTTLWDNLAITFEPSFPNEEFVVFDKTGEYCYHANDEVGLHYSQSATHTFKLTTSNIFHYYRLYNFLKSKYFADHHNSANNEIVIYSSAKGIFKITYFPIPIIDGARDNKEIVDQIISFASIIQFQSFFKNSLFTFSNGTGVVAVTDILAKGADILEAAKRDYDLVSKQFDFDKFRDLLYKEKEKYFNNIRDIVNKIFSQAIGIPLSIGASVFATYKADNDVIVFILILVTFILYITFYIKLQLIYKSDLSEIRNDFEVDFNVIRDKSGLSLDIIDKEGVKVRRKISNSISTINTVIVIIIMLGLIVSLYIFYQILNATGSNIQQVMLSVIYFILSGPGQHN